jgi:glycine cleavage system H protein
VFPEDLRYSREHQWIRIVGTGPTARVGITHFAQDELGEIVLVSLPAVGAELRSGEPFGEVESSKTSSEIYAPVSGVVVSCNEVLEVRPELVNDDPYGEGWIVEIGVKDQAVLADLLDAAAYRAFLHDL